MKPEENMVPNDTQGGPNSVMLCGKQQTWQMLDRDNGAAGVPSGCKLLPEHVRNSPLRLSGGGCVCWESLEAL